MRRPIAVAMRWALDLGGAVETLHNMGLVHGAVRPGNVVVLADGRAKLLDVELAGLRDVPALLAAPTREAPAQYMAPEQVHRGPLTEKADIYAFAVVLYEMLTGALPFQAATREAVRERQMTETPTPMRSRRRAVPAAVDAVVGKALDRQPDARPLMQDILNRLWSEANGPATSRRRLVVIAGSTVLAASVVGLAVWGFVALRASAPTPPEQATRPATVGPLTPTAPPVSTAPVPTAVPAPTAPTRPAEPARPAPVAAPPPVVAPAPVAAPAPASPGMAPVPPPPRPLVSPPPRPAPTSAGVERREPPRVERASPPAAPPRAAAPSPAPASVAAPERPAPPRTQDPYDPGAVIDWLLNPTGRRE